MIEAALLEGESWILSRRIESFKVQFIFSIHFGRNLIEFTRNFFLLIEQSNLNEKISKDSLTLSIEAI